MSSWTGTEYRYQAVDGRAIILACRSLDDRAEVPEEIDGYPVAELAPYAFSERRVDQGEGRWSGGGSIASGQEPPLLCGDRLKEIRLPAGLSKIGRYAFYNCSKLERFGCHSGISDLGSGLFTACRAVRSLTIRIEPRESSCLKELLSELRQSLTVDYRCGEGRAVLIFPDFFEEAVEHTPARKVMTAFHGCGHRYRNCFEQRELKFAEYDSLFPHVVVQEPEELVLRLALGRLRYPLKLGEKARDRYLGYVEEHWEAAGRMAVEDEDEKLLPWLLETAAPNAERLEKLLNYASAQNHGAALSALMNYRHEHVKTVKKHFGL